MNVFMPYPNILESVKSLDTRRLNKQQIECGQILKALLSEGAWSNHPTTKMWAVKTHILSDYIRIAKAELSFRRDKIEIPKRIISRSLLLEQELSGWLPEKFFVQHRRRLFTKDPIFYRSFKQCGESLVNYYFVEGNILRYNTENNKKETPLPVIRLSMQVCSSL